MPKKGNYNQDYYKIRGKDPGNQDVQPERTRQEYSVARSKPWTKPPKPKKETKKQKGATSRETTPR